MRSVFLDISKAFDRVWHRGLIYKLKQVGIEGLLLEWLSHYLKDRKHRVVLPSVSSERSFLKTGVSQGSILGPLIFLFINDIVLELRLFVDDTSLYI